MSSDWMLCQFWIAIDHYSYLTGELVIFTESQIKAYDNRQASTLMGLARANIFFLTFTADIKESTSLFRLFSTFLVSFVHPILETSLHYFVRRAKMKRCWKETKILPGPL